MKSSSVVGRPTIQPVEKLRALLRRGLGRSHRRHPASVELIEHLAAVVEHLLVAGERQRRILPGGGMADYAAVLDDDRDRIGVARGGCRAGERVVRTGS